MRGWLKLAAAIVALVLLLLTAWLLLRGVTGMAGMTTTLGDPEPDPMFAEPEARVTRPPEDDDAAPVVSSDEDPSLDWVYETLTPVEQTASELADAP